MMNNKSQAAGRFGGSINYGSAQDALNSGAPTVNEVQKQLKSEVITGAENFKFKPEYFKDLPESDVWYDFPI